jgi:hypothetical protein
VQGKTVPAPQLLPLLPDYAGYQPAYDSFTACISAGNTIDPIEDYGAICDGKLEGHGETGAP